MFIPVSILTGGQESMFKNRMIFLAPICRSYLIFLCLNTYMYEYKQLILKRMDWRTLSMRLYSVSNFGIHGFMLSMR
jgi:hypothetical protein